MACEKTKSTIESDYGVCNHHRHNEQQGRQFNCLPFLLFKARKQIVHGLVQCSLQAFFHYCHDLSRKPVFLLFFLFIFVLLRFIAHRL